MRKLAPISNSFIRKFGTVALDSPLSDTFGRYHNYLRMSLTEKCNLRCVYCMPAEGVKLTSRDKLMSLEERKRTISLFVRLGINKMRFTGGEPTISNQLLELVQHSRDCGINSIGITTNGLVLGKQPHLLDGLVKAGLTSINVSLDTLSPEKFAKISRRDEKGLFKVLHCIYSAVARQDISVKINCVLMRGTNDDELLDFVAMTKDTAVDCRFIELMPFDGNEWSPNKMMSYLEAMDTMVAQHAARQHGRAQLRPGDSEQLTLKHSHTQLLLTRELKHLQDKHDTTKWYRVSHEPSNSNNSSSSLISDGDGACASHLGRVGFITSMSSHFCGGCNRLRVTADGNLKVCLFGKDEVSMIQLMRAGCSDDDIVQKISAAVKMKHAALGGFHSPQELAKELNRPMILIGG